MALTSRISSKGQITVPLEIRRRLGLKEGDRVEFVADGERTVIRPGRPAEDLFEKYAGALPAFHSKGEIDAWVKSLRDEEATNALELI